jgi:hypothetical protein
MITVIILGQRLGRTFVGLEVFCSWVLGLFPCGFSWVYFVVCFFGVLFGFWGFSSFGLVYFLWLALVVPLYTPSVLRGALRVLIKLLLLIKKKKRNDRAVGIKECEQRGV